MRNRFIEGLIKHAERDSKIVLIIGDLGFGVVEPFAEKFPDRFFNSGVAEQNMMGMAAGLASEGHHVFVYSIANFPIFRCAEQVRNDVCYHELNVTIVSVGGGLAYGNLGYSHHAIQDYAFLRSLPHLKILSPGDPAETSSCLDYIIENPGPSYLRLGKAGEKNFASESASLTPGEFNVIRRGREAKTAILSTGSVLQDVMAFFETLNDSEIDILTCPIWGMSEKAKIQDQLIRYERVVTVENHLLDGGFGSWVIEVMAPKTRSKVRTVGLSSSVCGVVGSQESMHELGGLSRADILTALKDK